MPSAPIGFCPAPGCHQRSNGPCKAHRQQREQRRSSRHERGYDNRWADYSKQRLARFPWCVGYPVGSHTEGRRLAEVTDHIVSAMTHPELFWDETNHQSLCGTCNRRKAVAEEGRFGR